MFHFYFLNLSNKIESQIWKKKIQNSEKNSAGQINQCKVPWLTQPIVSGFDHLNSHCVEPVTLLYFNQKRFFSRLSSESWSDQNESEW